MRYTIVLYRSDEGYSVSIPSLPGCCSQGSTKTEAIDNIKDAAQEYLSVAKEVAIGNLPEGAEVHEIELTV